MSRSLKWLFFDVGGTLFDDEPVYAFQEELILKLLNRHECEVNEKEWASARRAARRYYLPRYISHLIWIFTEDPAKYQKVSLEYEKTINKTSYKRFKELVKPLSGMKDLLLDVSQRYHLGIIGNQPAMIRRRLEDEDLLKFFQVQALSTELGLRKPDLRFFLAALSMAQCQPDESVMIGDRLDNDIFPARMLGMTTVRLKVGPHRHQPVLSPEYLPHYTVTSTRALAKLLTSDELQSLAEGAEMMW